MFQDVESKIKRKNAILFSKESPCLQFLFQRITQQKHTTLVLWAMDCVEKPLNFLKEKYPEEGAFAEAYETSLLWAEGRVKMPVAQKAILSCHGVAKKIVDPVDVALCHAVAQGCSTVHTEKHAPGLVLYELTALVIQQNFQNYQSIVEQKISFYEQRLNWWESRIEQEEEKRTWAKFLKSPIA